ncbi:MAG: thioredoxin family protein [Saprospiraceae bacterium]|nr:thioredoxin family protein [Saprospiraceae bacterium]
MGRFLVFAGFILFCSSCNTKKQIPVSYDITYDEVVEKAETEQVRFDTIIPPKKDSVTFKMKEIDFAFIFMKSKNLSSVLDSAGARNKLVYLDLNVSWCIPCKLMQRDVYTHQSTADFFNDNFVNYMVDVELEEGPDLKFIYDVHSLPTLLFLDAKGRVIHRTEGGKYHSELIENARIALEKAKMIEH